MVYGHTSPLLLFRKYAGQWDHIWREIGECGKWWNEQDDFLISYIIVFCLVSGGVNQAADYTVPALYSRHSLVRVFHRCAIYYFLPDKKCKPQRVTLYDGDSSLKEQICAAKQWLLTPVRNRLTARPCKNKIKFEVWSLNSEAFTSYPRRCWRKHGIHMTQNSCYNAKEFFFLLNTCICHEFRLPTSDAHFCVRRPRSKALKVLISYIYPS